MVMADGSHDFGCYHKQDTKTFIAETSLHIDSPEELQAEAKAKADKAKKARNHKDFTVSLSYDRQSTTEVLSNNISPRLCSKNMRGVRRQAR